MAEALYRKYRPSTFEAVSGQEHVKRTLLNQIQSGSVAHAYLFSGPRGVGKTTIARLLAKSVNCLDRKGGEPCGACVACQAFEQGRTLDIIEMDAASHTGVDNVRENIIEAVRVPPGVSKRKVFIIDEVHMLSTSAFNALLKTLEEPPAHALFILATTEVHKIPQTILSRCQRFDFRRLDASAMKERLSWMAGKEGVEVDDLVLDAVIRVSEGCLRDAESTLGQLLALGEKTIDVDTASLVLPVTYVSSAIDLLESLSRNNAKECLDHLGVFVTQGGSIRHLIDECLSLVRALLFIQLGSSDIRYDETTQERLTNLASSLNQAKTRWLLDALLGAKVKKSSDIFPQLPLELMCVEFVGLFSEGNVEEPPAPPTPPPAAKKEVKPVASAETAKPEPKKVTEEPASQSTSSADIQIEDLIDMPDEPEPVPEEIKVEQKESPAAAPVKAEPDNVEEGQEEAHGEASFSVEDLAAKWKRCCELVSKENIALPLVLNKAKPLKVKGSIVEIGFEHRFHYDTMQQAKNSDMLMRAINEVMQKSVSLEMVYMEQNVDDTVDELVEAFGGSVVA